MLLQKNCKITAEKPPETISAKQGSLWGMSPRTAKKTITWQLSPAGSTTRIAASSSLSSDWKNMTIVGSALSIVVAAVCLWISADLEGFLSTLQPSWWSWIAFIRRRRERRGRVVVHCFDACSGGFPRRGRCPRSRHLRLRKTQNRLVRRGNPQAVDLAGSVRRCGLSQVNAL